MKSVDEELSHIERVVRSTRLHAAACLQGIAKLPELRVASRRERCDYYLGWLGHDNLGDEAIFKAYRSVFPDLHFTDFPLGRVFAVAKVLSDRPRLSSIFLGGGTLIGQSGYRRSLETLFEHYPQAPAFMLGPGVEDPDFHDDETRIHDELSAWKPLLRRFHRVTVRGPRSQEILEDHGFRAEMIGDPALLLSDEAPSEHFEENLLGINIGWSPSMWGNDPTPVRHVLTSLCRELARSGWRFRLVPFGPRDVAITQELAASLGGRVEVCSDFRDISATLSSLRECHAFIGQKLHSVVLASAVYVPSVMLEYRPKCFDFQRSLGREHYTIRTDRLTVEELHTKLLDIHVNRAAHQEMISRRVKDLISRQIAYAQEVRSLLAP